MRNLVKAYLMVIFVFLAAPCFAVDKLVFTTAIGNNFNYIGQYVLQEAYKKLGIQVEILRVPSKRSLAMSSTGQSDGEVHRIKNLSTKFPDLIQISIPINHLDLVVYSRNPSTPIKKPEDLRPYMVGFYRGAKIFEKMTNGFENIKMTTHPDQALKMLAQNRLDLVLGDSVSAPAIVKKNNIKGVYMLSPPIKQIRLYHYINKRHAPLVPKITSILKEMEKSGRIEKIRDNTIFSFSNGDK